MYVKDEKEINKRRYISVILIITCIFFLNNKTYWILILCAYQCSFLSDVLARLNQNITLTRNS